MGNQTPEGGTPNFSFASIRVHSRLKIFPGVQWPHAASCAVDLLSRLLPDLEGGLAATLHHSCLRLSGDYGWMVRRIPDRQQSRIWSLESV